MQETAARAEHCAPRRRGHLERALAGDDRGSRRGDVLAAAARSRARVRPIAAGPASPTSAAKPRPNPRESIPWGVRVPGPRRSRSSSSRRQRAPSRTPASPLRIRAHAAAERVDAATTRCERPRPRCVARPRMSPSIARRTYRRAPPHPLERTSSSFRRSPASAPSSSSLFSRRSSRWRHFRAVAAGGLFHVYLAVYWRVFPANPVDRWAKTDFPPMSRPTPRTSAPWWW